MSYTVNQLAARASALTGMSDQAGTDDRSLMDQWSNEGIFKVFQETQCVITDVTATLVAGTDEYALDTGIITTLNYAKSTNAPSAKISVISAKEILERRYLQSDGDVRYYAVLGGNILIVSPVPATADTLHLFVVPVPDTVSGSTDIHSTGLPTYAKRAVECYLYARCFEQQREFEAAQYWDSQYLKEISQVKTALHRQGGRTLTRTRIGYPDRYAVPSRNDTYPGY